MNTIYTRNLTKKYGNKNVLSGIDLDISSGSIVGLLGKNGAGKTTLNRILTGLAFPTSGEVLIAGEKPECGAGKISFLSENISIYPTLTAYENLSQIFLINGLKPDKSRIEEILDIISIENSRKKVGKFSLGMKRRLQIAMSILVVERDIIILDEPTNGLDINGVLWLKELLISLGKKQKTLIITSHAIRELEDTLTHYSIIANGKISAFGEMGEIGHTNIVITLKNEDIINASEQMTINAIDYTLRNNTILIPAVSQDLSKKCLSILMEQQIVPMNFTTEKKSLVDVFMAFSEDGEKHD